jgi:hypothetical protein
MHPAIIGWVSSSPLAAFFVLSIEDRVQRKLLQEAKHSILILPLRSPKGKWRDGRK